MASPAWGYPGYAYRRLCAIASCTDNPQLNYPMRLTVFYATGTDTISSTYLRNRCRTDFNDIRFTAADGITHLSYHRESYTLGVSAVVFIRIPSLPPLGTTIYIYFGFPTAVDASDPDHTFTWAYRASVDAYPGTKWTGDTGFGSVTGGILTLAGTTGGVEKAINGNLTVPAAQCAIRARIKHYVITGVSDWGLQAAHVARFLYSAGVLLDSYDGAYSSVASNWTTGAFVVRDIIVRPAINSRFFDADVELVGSPKTTNPPNDATMAATLRLTTANGDITQATDNGDQFLPNDSTRNGERFTNFPAVTILSIDFKMWKGGFSPTGTIYCNVRRVSDDGLIGTLGTLNAATLTGVPTWYTFNTPVVNPAVQDIRISIEFAGASRMALKAYTAGSLYAGGVRSQYFGVAWTDYAAQEATWQHLLYSYAPTVFDLDWIYIRKYDYPEPIWQHFGSPQFDVEKRYCYRHHRPHPARCRHGKGSTSSIPTGHHWLS